MSILRDKRPSVHSLLGSKLPKPVRPFGVGLVDDDEGPDQAAWRDAVDRGHYEDEPCELPEAAWYEPEPDEPDGPATGDLYWNSELSHLEGLLPLATPLRRLEIERRIDSVLAMLGLPAPARKPRLYEPDVNDRIWWAQETERLQAESMERQLAEAWAMSEIEAGAERFDGRGWEEQELCRAKGGVR